MRKRILPNSILLGLLAVLAAVLAAITWPSPAAGQEGANVRLEQQDSVLDGADVIRVDVVVENVADLGAFEFVLTFDGELVKPVEGRVERGPFLDSSGREAFCDEPTIEADALRHTCVTLGDTPAHGADGSGIISTIYLEPREAGTAKLEFSRGQLSTPQGQQIPAEWQSLSVKVRGGDGMATWAIVLIAVGVAAAVAVAGALVYARLRARRRTADTPSL